MTGRGREGPAGNHPLHVCWTSMRARCLRPNHKSYKNYGGRGILIDPMWDQFWTFLFDMGPKPTPQHSLDRINNDGNYEPSNCRWATSEQQHASQRYRNGRSGGFRFLPYAGERHSVSGWAIRAGVTQSAISHRLRKRGPEHFMDGLNI